MRQQAAPRGAAALLHDLLDKADRAAARWRDAADTDALHDFRVALRRLHTNLRAYRDCLDADVGEKFAKRARRLARATNTLRDREVQIAWLRAQCGGAVPRARRRLEAMIAQLHAEQAAQQEQWQGRTLAGYAQFAAELRRQLRRRGTRAATFVQQANRRVHAHSVKLVRRLAVIDGVEDTAAAHAARIAGKRLRYVLEPLATEVPGAARAIRRLKALQDLLGELHDCQVRLDDVVRDADAHGALRRRTEARRAELFATLHCDWLGVRIDALDRSLQKLAVRS